MLIYNHKKEFIGISEKDLKHFKLSSLAELQTEASDFADLFVKVAGYVHNFKHVHWLDFISSADSIDENKVIISIKGKNYKAILKLQALYLADNPSSPGYAIELTGVRELTAQENEAISGDLAQRSIEKATTAPIETAVASLTPQEEEEPQELVDFQNEDTTNLIEDPYATTNVEEHDSLEIDINDLYEANPEVEQTSAQTQSATTTFIDEDDKFKDYVYDPEVASNDLGLPIDLVEEFIEDFISQALEFKDEMYRSLDEGDMDTLKSTSHKLKGVAANLRIEDAYDALVIINTSDNVEKIRQNMDKFYNYILKKLSGEEVATPQAENETIVVDETPKEETEQQQEDSLIDFQLDQENEEDKIDLGLDLTENSTQEQEEEKVDIDLDLQAPQEEMIELSLDETQEEQKEDDSISLDLETPQEEDFTLEIEEPSKEEEKIDLSLDLEETTSEEEANKFDLDEITIEQQPQEELSLDIETLSLDDEPTQNSFTIDKEEIASHMGIDVATYENLLNDYIQDMKKGLEELKQSIIQGDQERYNKLILRLKGMSDTMVLDSISKDFELLLDDNTTDKMAVIEKVYEKVDSINRMV